MRTFNSNRRRSSVSSVECFSCPPHGNLIVGDSGHFLDHVDQPEDFYVLDAESVHAGLISVPAGQSPMAVSSIRHWNLCSSIYACEPMRFEVCRDCCCENICLANAVKIPSRLFSATPSTGQVFIDSWDAVKQYNLRTWAESRAGVIAF